MAKITVTHRNGTEQTLDFVDRIALMELIRDGGIEDVFALCGGCCSCATCHVYIDQHFQHFLPEMSQAEADLLASSAHRTNTSRLSCQVFLDPQLDGMHVQVAPED